jgi:hypothetical protein
MIAFLLVSLGVILLAIAILSLRDWARDEHPGFWSDDATARARHQIRIAGRGQFGIVRVSRGLL